MVEIRRTARAWLATVSPLGWTVLFIGALSWIAGVLWGWEELLVIAGMVAVLGTIAVVLTTGQLALAASITVAPSRVQVGDRAAGELRLENLRSRATRGLRVEVPVGEALAAYAVTKLAGGSATSELFVVPTNRRAVISVGPVATVQGDPLEMLRRSRVWSDVDEIFVHPRTERLSTMAAGLIRDMEGQPTNRLSPSDIAFHTLREYVPGDDRRHVHWKSSAKRDKLMVRQYVDTRRSNVAVLLSLDLTDYASEEEFELAVSCAASVGLQAQRDKQALSVFAGDGLLPSVTPRRMLDGFSRLEGRARAGGYDDALRIAHVAAAGVSLAILCVGSVPSIADVRRASARVSSDTTLVVLRADLGSESRFRSIGSCNFVDVPSLDRLSRGLEAVMS